MKILFILLFFLPLTTNGAPCPSCSTDFAVYAPGIPGDGVWRYEVESLTKMFQRFHWSYEIVNFTEIRAGYLGQGNSRKFHGLVMAGGQIIPRANSLGVEGKKAIDYFIQSGGNYIGFCAGSYFAGENWIWGDPPTGEGGSYYMGSDYHIFREAGMLGLFPGLPMGPFGWAPYRNGTVADGLEDVELNLSLPVLSFLRVPHFTKLFYYGGPFFHFRIRPKDLEIWARAIKPQDIPDAESMGDGQATVIRYHYGLGGVILFSYHPVVLLGGKIDGEFLETPFLGKVSRTDPAPFTLDQVNIQSLNLLHGALQLTSDRPLTPISLGNVHTSH